MFRSGPPARIAFDASDTTAGELSRGRIDAAPAAVTASAQRVAGQGVTVGLEACTGPPRRRRVGGGRGGEWAALASLQPIRRRNRSRRLVFPSGAVRLRGSEDESR